LHTNEVATWAVDVRYEKERDGYQKAVEPTSGFFRFSFSRTVTNQQVATDGDRYHQTQADRGIRFHQAACVHPCEFNSSFMPETAKATTAVGCVAAGASTWTTARSAIDQ
jgi:hypothetical protein